MKVSNQSEIKHFSPFTVGCHSWPVVKSPLWFQFGSCAIQNTDNIKTILCTCKTFWQNPCVSHFCWQLAVMLLPALGCNKKLGPKTWMTDAKALLSLIARAGSLNYLKYLESYHCFWSNCTFYGELTRILRVLWLAHASHTFSLHFYNAIRWSQRLSSFSAGLI